MKVVQVRRWEVAFWFLGMGIAMTLALLALSSSIHHTRQMAKDNTRLIALIVANRRETVARIHAEQVRSCASRHKLYIVLDATVRRGVAQQRATLETAIVKNDPALLKIERAGIASSLQTLHDLRGADCHGVPPVSVKPPPPKPKAAG